MGLMIPNRVIDLVVHRSDSMNILELGVSERNHILSVAHSFEGILHHIDHGLRVAHSVCIVDGEIFRLEKVAGLNG